MLQINRFHLPSVCSGAEIYGNIRVIPARRGQPFTHANLNAINILLGGASGRGKGLVEFFLVNSPSSCGSMADAVWAQRPVEHL